MKTIAIDKNNDICLDNSNNLAVKTNLEAMGDIFVNKSQTILGELAYNQEKGIDFFNTIFSSPTYLDLYQNQLISQLEDTEETQKISNFNGTIQNGVFEYTLEAQTSYGKITLNG
ncbi:MAG: hypothetical protein KH321_03315 [Clostridium sp.]|jgi:hypothetical protein|nr:hypothetical protein [Clostridium sp.]